MSEGEFIKMLEDNGFSYYKHAIHHYCYVIKNLNIVNYEPKIENITVDRYKCRVYIYFKAYQHYIPPFELNLNLNLGMEGYVDWSGYSVYKKFSNKNDLIEGLHRLNSIGLNIKGAKK